MYPKQVPQTEVLPIETKRDEEIIRIELDPDTKNDWYGLNYIYQASQRGDIETAKLLLSQRLSGQDTVNRPHYKEAVKRKNPNDFEHIIILSDPEKIEAYDAIVDDFNNTWPDILENLDFERAKKYYDQIEDLLRR